MYYRSYRIINGKAKWIIIDENYKIILNPSDDQIKTSISGNPPKKCCKCGSLETYARWSGYNQWYNHRCDKINCTRNLCKNCYRFHVDWSETKEYLLDKMKNRKCCECGTNKSRNDHWYNHICDNNNCTEFLCKDCWNKDYSRLPDSVLNINSLWRRGQINIDGNNGKGLIGEVVIAKIRRLDVLSIKLDNFRSKFDLSSDFEYGMIQSKFCSLRYGTWYANFGIEYNFDTLFALCVSTDRKNVKRVYVVPDKELYGITGIDIYEYSSKGIPWYEKYRIDNEPYNDAYHNLMEYLNNKILLVGNKKFFYVKDIKEWLKK